LKPRLRSNSRDLRQLFPLSKRQGVMSWEIRDSWRSTRYTSVGLPIPAAGNGTVQQRSLTRSRLTPGLQGTVFWDRLHCYNWRVLNR
jgi:hypothetical protein